MTQLQIPYFHVDASKSLIAEALSRYDSEHIREVKAKALRDMGIEVPEGTEEYEFSDIWGRHIHEINGLEFTKPYHPAIVSAIRENVEVYKFFFFLA